MIDDIDRQILALLQQNGRTSNAEIARRIGMVPSGVLERIRKLEERGVIRGYEVDVDPRALGFGVLSYIFVRAEKSERPTAELLAEIPEVLEIHHIAGEDCYILKTRVADTESLGRLLENKINAIPAVSSTRTTIVLSTIKETNYLPIAVYSEQQDV